MRHLLLVAVVLLPLAAAAQPATRSASAPNDRAVAEALRGFGVDARGAAWQAVPDAFDALYPNERYGQVRLSDVQARAVAFTAMTFAAGDTPRGGPRGNGPVRTEPPRYAPTAADALGLAHAFLALVPTRGRMPEGADRAALVARGAEAAGVAGAAGCGGLATSLATVTSRLRADGFAFSSEVEDAQRSASGCR